MDRPDKTQSGRARQYPRLYRTTQTTGLSHYRHGAWAGKTVEQLDINNKLALCFGSEEPGLSANLQALADETVRIPIHGFTQSYNLSVSAGISLYTLGTNLRNSSVNWQLDERDATDLFIKWLAQSTPSGEPLLENYLTQLKSSP